MDRRAYWQQRNGTLEGLYLGLAAPASTRQSCVNIDPVTMIQTLPLLSFRTLEDLGLSDVWITMAGPIIGHMRLNFLSFFKINAVTTEL